KGPAEVRRVREPRVERGVGQRRAAGKRFEPLHQAQPQQVGSKRQARLLDEQMPDSRLRQPGQVRRIGEAHGIIESGLHPSEYFADASIRLRRSRFTGQSLDDATTEMRELSIVSTAPLERGRQLRREIV